MPPTSTTVQETRIHPLTSVTDRLVLEDLFPKVAPIEIELGSGDGSFLISHAARNPGLNLVGVERLLGRLKKTNRKAIRAGLSNVRLIRIEAAYFLEWLLPASSIVAVHVYFPDPWPKRRHRKLRLVNQNFPELAFRVLKSGGQIHLRTDHADYAAQMAEVMNSDHRFLQIEIPNHLLEIVTDFEADFIKQGLPIYRSAFQKIPS